MTNIKHDNDLLVAGTLSGNLLLFGYPAVTSNCQPQVIKAHTKGVSNVAFADDSNRLISVGSTDGIIIQVRSDKPSLADLSILYKVASHSKQQSFIEPKTQIKNQRL